jgi:hypothetical protein
MENVINNVEKEKDPNKILEAIKNADFSYVLNYVIPMKIAYDKEIAGDDKDNIEKYFKSEISPN